MKHILLRAVLALPLLAGAAFGQGPDGSDINKAIPIAFGQIVENIGDVRALPTQVYKIVLAKGQRISAVAKTRPGNSYDYLAILAPSALSVASLKSGDKLGDTDCSGGCQVSALAAVGGTYYVWIAFRNTGINYSLQVTAEGTPIAVPNPTSAGCLIGKVDSITYSLQFIALGLPDEVVIGGAKACATCTAKPPLYPEISNRLEAALRSNSAVEACYDSAGNIFQLKLVRQ